MMKRKGRFSFQPGCRKVLNPIFPASLLSPIAIKAHKSWTRADAGMMARPRMEFIFFKGSHGIKDQPEHFGLIATELMKGSQ